MNFTMTTPCANCPFRTDCPKGWLGRRITEIANAITRQQQTFACHKTVEHDDEGEHVPQDDEQHCAGSLILLEKLEQPNQMMRICERLGMYDRTKLKMDAPVFDSLDKLIAHHRGPQRERDVVQS